ncbi:hypothetical protein F0562_014392 [Nyssa sinensis]|uniref:Uncharacterized protein n=1 Tax=Nyssa sinensis TaxID=561372 RepID=A0A5J4ZQZ2_9ASTE|nr:hypothetical protein F0562_014392 [Nyssa sinensis]
MIESRESSPEAEAEEKRTYSRNQSLEEASTVISDEVVGGCVDKVIVSTGDHDGVMVVMEVLELARVVVLALVVVRAVGIYREKRVM